MKTRFHRSMLFLLILTLLLSGCGKTVTPSETTGDGVSESGAHGEELSETDVLPPVETPTIYLPEPYIDIDFSADGKVSDAAGHVDCTLADTSKGSVKGSEVTFEGQNYTLPHYVITSKGGVIALRYKEITQTDQLLTLLKDGFTVETFIVNHNRLTSSDTEQCLISTTNSGGFNFSTYKGTYTFSVNTAGKYHVSSYPGDYSTTELTHLVGVYDPINETGTLYANGVEVAHATAAGLLTLAQATAWQTIIIGGDIANDGVSPELMAADIELTDYKIYAATATKGQVKTMFEKSVSDLTGSKLDYNVEYSDEKAKEAAADGIFVNYQESYVTNIYEPATGISASPTIVQLADKATLESIDEERRPATVLFEVKSEGGELCAYTARGEKLGTLREAVTALKTRAIPAFRIASSADKNTLMDFVDQNHIGDCFIISTDSKLLKYICDSTHSARPVLDVTASPKLTADEIFIDASSCGSKCVIIAQSAATQEFVLELQSRSIFVFVAAGDTSDVTTHNVTFSGANGIITTDYKAVISYLNTIIDRTFSRSQLISAHRGDVSNCQQNTMTAFRSGAESGATVMEFDVWLTTDNALAISHDNTVLNYTPALKCNESTRAQLEAMKSTDPHAAANEKLAFYDEVMEYFSKNHPEMIFTVEIKDMRTKVVDRVVEMTKEYGMEGRVLVICGNWDIVRYAYNTYGCAIQMNLSYAYDSSQPIASSLSAVCTECTDLHSSFFTTWSTANRTFSDRLRHRGIKYSPWTTNSAYDTDNDFTKRFPEFTSNSPHECDSYMRYLKVEIDNNGKLTATRINYNGAATDVTDKVEPVVISGGISYKDGTVSGSGSIAFRLKTTLPLITTYEYYIYSTAITK